MEIIRHASLKAAQWAGGTSRTIAAASNGDWRVTLDEHVKAAALAPAPDMERVLAVAEGDLIALSVDGAEQALEEYRTFRFTGDASVSLPTGAVKSLTVLARRGTVKGFATILELSKKRPHPVFADQFAVLLKGSATVSLPQTDHGGPSSAAPVTDTLGGFDTVVGAEPAPEISGRGFIAVVSIDPA